MMHPSNDKPHRVTVAVQLRGTTLRTVTVDCPMVPPASWAPLGMPTMPNREERLGCWALQVLSWSLCSEPLGSSYLITVEPA